MKFHHRRTNKSAIQHWVSSHLSQSWPANTPDHSIREVIGEVPTSGDAFPLQWGMQQVSFIHLFVFVFWFSFVVVVVVSFCFTLFCFAFVLFFTLFCFVSFHGGQLGDLRPSKGSLTPHLASIRFHFSFSILTLGLCKPLHVWLWVTFAEVPGVVWFSFSHYFPVVWNLTHLAYSNLNHFGLITPSQSQGPFVITENQTLSILCPVFLGIRLVPILLASKLVPIKTSIGENLCFSGELLR